MSKDFNAFPGMEECPVFKFYYPGLSKREYYAALAMQGLAAGCDPKEVIYYGVLVKDAVALADALGKELEGDKW